MKAFIGRRILSSWAAFVRDFVAPDMGGTGVLEPDKGVTLGFGMEAISSPFEEFVDGEWFSALI